MREKLACRGVREGLAAAGALPHDTARLGGLNLLATIIFEKYGQHLPLNRQRERYAGEGVDLSLSTLADQMGACAAALKPLRDLIAAHVLPCSKRLRRTGQGGEARAAFDPIYRSRVETH